MVVRFVSDGFLKDDEERGVVVVWERKAEGDGVALRGVVVVVLMVSNALFVFTFQKRFWKNLKFFIFCFKLIFFFCFFK